MPELQQQYVAQALREDPIRATTVGVHEYGHTLGDIAADAIADCARGRARILAACEGSPEPEPGSIEWLDRETLLIELRVAVHADQATRVWARAPYWYAERVGAALMPLLMHEFATVEERGRMLFGRLEEIPAYLATARVNLARDEVPREWADMGATAAQGLRDFLSGAVRAFAGSLPESLANDVTRAADRGASAANEYLAFAQELTTTATGDWRAGRDVFDFLLHELHRVEFDHASLAAHGRDRVASDGAMLREFASSVNPHMTWVEQLSDVKNRHPQPSEFVNTYGAEMQRARQHALAVPLITIPDGEECVMGWVPSYLAASLPIAVVHMSPSFELGLRSEWLITPSSPEMSAERRLEQMRDNCYVFAESIAGHETYPGHHLQKVHHKIATAESAIRRLFTSPSFVEGWGLYVEDIQDETGFFDNDDVRLFRYRNSLWRSVRVVVDTGLHSGDLSTAEAVALLQEQAGLDTYMATGEVRRYIRHDNPTYPSSYLVGREAIHKLRAKWTAAHEGRYSHQAFHDWLLSFGSVPVALVERMLGA
jgi:hypothetical protein